MLAKNLQQMANADGIFRWFICWRFKGQDTANMGTTRENLTFLFAKSKCADKPAHPYSLISISVVHSLEIIIDKLAVCLVSIF